MRVFLQYLALLVALVAAPLAQAQAPTNIAAELVAERAVARPGETIQLAVSMKPAKGWHGYWENGGDAGFAAQFDWRLPPGAKIAAPRYPVPETLLINGLMNHVYEYDYALLVPFTVPADARPGATLPIAAEAQWLACTDEICVPEQGRIATTVRVGAPSPRDRRFDRWLARLPAPLPEISRFAFTGDALRLAVPIPAALALEQPHFFVRTERVASYSAPQRFSREGNTLIIELDRATGASAASAPAAIEGVLRFGAGEGLTIRATPGAVPPAGTPVGPAAAPAWSAGLAGILFAALLGGLILNVMPCVFPILSLKALALAQAGTAPGKARADGLAYTAGVVLACLALGALMLALRAAGNEVGWAFQLQEPLVVAALLLLALAITANFAGLYELPSLGGAHGERGAFATGLLAAFVATPCSGPFMAAAIGAALVLPTALALTVFAALGLGLSLPFLLLGFIPALRRMLPRPGPWMLTFRRAMAIPMALTALALAWLAWRVGGLTFALAAIAAGAVLLGLLAYTGTRQRRGAGVAATVSTGLTAIVLAGALGLPPLVTGAAAAEGLPGAKPFSQATLAKARATGKPVFVYFTADWCLTCKVNEAGAIARDTTRAAFDREAVQVIVGDWTRRDPAITRFLAAHGAAGVPLYLWYPAQAQRPQVLPQVLTPAMLEQCASGAACG